jgi:hypothetical protein
MSGSIVGTVSGLQKLCLIALVLLEQHFAEGSELNKAWFSVA